MSWTKTTLRGKAFLLFAALALLTFSLVLAACDSGAKANGSSNNAGSSNISTSQQQAASTSTPGSNGIQNADQQVQNAIQSVNNAGSDTNNADATATAQGDTPQQP